jgi:predicted nucleic acid-binding protein
MRVLLDTNILLDVLLKRLPWEAEALAIWQASEESRLMASVTSLSVANMFYVARRHAGQEKAIRAVHQCLQVFNILPVDRGTLQAGLVLPSKDFEDNLQIVAAVEAGLDAVVTRNPSDFAACPLPVLTPQELVVKSSGDNP